MPYSRATFRYEPDEDESDGDEVGELKNIKTKQNVFLGYNVSSPAKTAVSGWISYCMDLIMILDFNVLKKIVQLAHGAI